MEFKVGVGFETGSESDAADVAFVDGVCVLCGLQPVISIRKIKRNETSDFFMRRFYSEIESPLKVSNPYVNFVLQSCSNLPGNPPYLRSG